MLRTVKWALWAAGTQGLLLLLLAWLLPGFDVASVWAAFATGLIGALAAFMLWPAVYSLARRFHPILFPIVAFLLTGLGVYLIAKLIDLTDSGAVQVDSVWTGIQIALGLTVGNTLLAVCFGLDDAQEYDRFVTREIRRAIKHAQTSHVPGVLFIEIDGLAEPILRQALAAGYMPTLKRWLDSGSHCLRRWEPDLSSQASASQAGILMGSNEGIPAFRWWDKESGTLMVSSKMSTARALEQRLSTGHGLLAEDGASRWNVFSGDAPDCLGTFSQIGRGTAGGQLSYYAYLTSPFSVARTGTLYLTDVVREWIEARRQRLEHVEPRIQRGFKYSFIRAGATVLLQEASVFMLISDVYRGVPAVYNTFFAYDEVAHHSGIDRRDGFKVLRSLDRAIAHVERAAQAAPRPYHLVVLSDHGQSQGATFRQRFGKTLGQLVDDLIDARQGVMHLESGDEGLSGINSALSEALLRDSRSMRLVRRATRQRTNDGSLVLGSERDATSDAAKRVMQGSDAVVVASGNLGLISFPRFPKRMTYEEISETYPGLLAGLSTHPGVSFVMVSSQADGGLVIGGHGVYYLRDGHVAGQNPLTPFGPNAASHLSRTNSFTTAPDILVMSMYVPETGEVAAFEELVGCHGGLGGPQTEPFLLYPVELPLDPDAPIIGAAELHRVLKSWAPSASATAQQPTAV